MELLFVNKVPAVNQYTESFIRSQNNQFPRTYWHQISFLNLTLLLGLPRTRTCCSNAQLPLGSQSRHHQSCTRPVFILPTMVHDCYVNMVEEVESVLLVKLWLQNIIKRLRNSSNRRGRKQSRTLESNEVQEKRWNTSTFTFLIYPYKIFIYFSIHGIV